MEGQRPAVRPGLRERRRLRRGEEARLRAGGGELDRRPVQHVVRPGPKKFDFDINEISYTPARAKVVDFSSSYYDVNQAIVGLKGQPIAKATSIADLKPYKLGAQLGTTSYDYIVKNIKPSQKPAVFDTNDAAVQALKNKQIDGLVVDLPTAFYVTAAQVPNSDDHRPVPDVRDARALRHGAREGQLARRSASTRRSPTLKASGTLAAIQQKWLAKAAGAPVLK